MSGTPTTRAELTEIVASDVASNLLVTNLMGLGEDPAVVGGFLISDVMFEAALRDWARDQYGGVGGGLEDELARNIVLKTIVSSVGIWATSRVAGQGVGAVAAAINAMASYMTSNGILQLLEVAR